MDVKPNWADWDEAASLSDLAERSPDHYASGVFPLLWAVVAITAILFGVPWLYRLRWLGEMYERYARWAAGQ